jgi:hypothetical protein
LNLQDKPAIRCKLNAPRLNHSKHWEYDGFMIAKDQRIFWIFERRNDVSGDYFNFITRATELFFRCYDDPRATDLTLSGTYLSVGQDDARSIVTDRILLQRRKFDDTDAMEDGMKKDLCILKGEDRLAIDKFLHSFEEYEKEIRDGHAPGDA